MSITIVGLGPGAAEDVTRRAWRALNAAQQLFLRTAQHGCVPALPPTLRYTSFDALYEAHDRFEEVYEAIIAQLLLAAREGDVVYAVPGDPLVGEATTTGLLAAARAEGIALHVVNGVSFVEPLLAQLGVDALDGLQLLDGLQVAAMHHPPLNPAFPALLAQLYSTAVASDVKLTLMNQYPDDFTLQLVHAAGTPGVQVETLPLYALDRSAQIGPLTALYLPALGEHSSFESAQEIVAHLRAPEGCPWDREQTHGVVAALPHRGGLGGAGGHRGGRCGVAGRGTGRPAAADCAAYADRQRGWPLPHERRAAARQREDDPAPPACLG